MNAVEIPLTPDNLSFSATVNSTIYQFTVIWRDSLWFVDLADSAGELIVGSLPLVTGADLLEQYTYLGLGFSLIVLCDDPAQDYPTKTDLGLKSHLYAVTE
nr:hypothetical protein [Pantoea cypripedii]